MLAIAGGRLAAVNTVERLQAAQFDFPEGAPILREAADAFRISLYYHGRRGSEIMHGWLFDELLLKTAFIFIERLLDLTDDAVAYEAEDTSRLLRTPEWRFAFKVRFIALDTETTGLDPLTEKIIIGGSCRRTAKFSLDDTFELLLEVAQHCSATVTMGSPATRLPRGWKNPGGRPPLDYLKDGVIVGHHIGHDIAALTCSLRERHFNLTLSNRSLDTMDNSRCTSMMTAPFQRSPRRRVFCSTRCATVACHSTIATLPAAMPSSPRRFSCACSAPPMQWAARRSIRFACRTNLIELLHAGLRPVFLNRQGDLVRGSQLLGDVGRASGFPSSYPPACPAEMLPVRARRAEPLAALPFAITQVARRKPVAACGELQAKYRIVLQSEIEAAHFSRCSTAGAVHAKGTSPRTGMC